MSEFDYATQYPTGTALATDGKICVWEAYVRDHDHVMEPEISDGIVQMVPK